ncbi:hypothetical protein FJ872_30060 [Mesorhizobium sp. B2-5-9]|uniref:hypothetical protein n=1 Tax=Mesorhizobium sp. B2-5-9 TaxID=2589921 RepID=UPI00112E15CA|nr:hypothetical protein [Mesorhizobium sp. B2-5-9]TPK00967.1 hypothetical protein FJ872_30060 [Mesorhizobium sp. B2-5-9]
MRFIGDHHHQLIRHYEAAILIQDRVIERTRRSGLPFERDEAFSKRLHQGLAADQRALLSGEGRR